MSIIESINKKNIVSVCKNLSIVISFLIIITSLWVLYYKYNNPSSTSLMSKREAESEKLGDNKKITIIWKEYEHISPYVVLAIITAEDHSFFKHNGFDFNAIKFAYLQNKAIGWNKYGASTISQQTAKNLFLWNGKSWFRKIAEVYFTMLIELFWSKERILEVYLNIIEYGDCVFGIEAAAKKYFLTTSNNLSFEQGALIASALPNPRKFSLHHPSSELKKRSEDLIIRIEDADTYLYGIE